MQSCTSIAGEDSSFLWLWFELFDHDMIWQLECTEQVGWEIARDETPSAPDCIFREEKAHFGSLNEAGKNFCREAKHGSITVQCLARTVPQNGHLGVTGDWASDLRVTGQFPQLLGQTAPVGSYSLCFFTDSFTLLLMARGWVAFQFIISAVSNP